MDGNRRFAKKNNLPLTEGYKKGMLQFYNILKWQVKNNIENTSFFALSLDNAHKRSKEELVTIKEVAKSLFSPEFEEYCINNQVEIRIKGRYFKNNKANEKKIKFDKKSLTHSNKKELLELKNNETEFIEMIEKKAKNVNSKVSNPKFYSNIALFYDGQEEISSTCQEIVQAVLDKEIKIEDITPQLFKEKSYFNNSVSPQIIVRTGDAPRISGFMLFDSAYSELYLTRKLWPELDENLLNEILGWFTTLKRNFGK